ncbi:uncharacterized protein [Phyllobates terribilis]|uniref:uncharacterized protein isoform X3 n=1 Tax=Phyllobates terribilis TaxID=111132 RepID=UPI003CCA8666
MAIMTNESRQLRATIQSLQSERDQLKEDLGENVQLSSSVENQLQETILLLKEAISEREIIVLSKEKLQLELKDLHNEIETNKLALDKSEKEGSEAGQKIHDLTAQLKAASEKWNQMRLTNEELLKLLTEILDVAQEAEDELQEAEDELQQQRQRVEKLKNEISLLEEKSSLLEGELQEKIQILDKAAEDRCVFDLAKQNLTTELEQVVEALKSKEFVLKEAEKEKAASSQKILDLTAEMESITQERDELQNSRQKLEEEVAQVQDELITSQTKLQTVTKERDESHAHLLEKVNEVKERLQEISSLQEQIQQLHEKVEAEQRKNFDLLEEVDFLEKKVRALHQMQNEPVQEEDELAERTEILEGKNQEWKDLMGKIYTVYSDHHSSLSNLSCELQSMTQTQNQSMSAIIESLSSTSSRTFGNLQTEHVKLNSEMQMLLYKFKGLYKNAAVEETHYSSVKDFENELCVLQKKNDQLLLQFQSLEQCGSKWSDTLAEELKDCEIEFITELIYKKDDVIKNVEDGFSEVKVLLNGMENELKQELKCKEEFIEWLSEFQGLHFDTKKLNDGVLQENRRITGVIQNLTKKLKIIAQSKTKQDTMQYLNTLKTDLREKKEKNLDLMQRMQKIAPSGDCSMLEEENARLRETLKNVQGELKSSSVENQLQETILLLKEAISEREIIVLSKEKLQLELKDLHNEIETNKLALDKSEKEGSEAGQKIHDLTAQLKAASEKWNQMQLTNEELQKLSTEILDELQKAQDELQEAEDELQKAQDELQQQRQRVEKLKNEIPLLEEKSSLLEGELQEKIQILDKAAEDRCVFDLAKQNLTTELEQVVEALKSKEFVLKEAEKEKAASSQKILDLTAEMESITQERDELQNSRQKLEEEVAQVQDELITSQTKLQTVTKERDESHAHLLEKVNEVKERLQEISSLQEQIQQLHEKVEAEQRKNFDLLEEVDFLEKKVRALHQMQNEPVQEEDELAERTEILEGKNQEWKDLMGKIYTVYSDHHSSLSNICCELQSMTQTQNQSMSAIKESLSSTSSRTFGNLQTEHVKLNSEMQMLLYKFKGLYKNAAVEETHYSSVKDFENELCVLQKKNDQLLLQFQSLEQCGSKWSDTLAEELKDCEIEFITELIYKKDDVIKNVEDGFSEVKVLLNGMENELKQELKCKEEFIEWLSEFQGLHFDTKKLNDGVLQENRRITGVIQNLTKKLKIIAQSKTKQDTMQYLNTLKTDLHEKKAKNLDLMQRMQKIAPSGDGSMLEEENARLRETLKTVQGELKVAQVQDELITSQTKLQTVTKERDESHAHLLEKVNEVKERLQEISSLQEQIQQLHEKVEAEQRKNFDLLEEVDFLEKKVRALHQMQNEPVQEEDELAERTEILEGKNQEWKDLMGKIYTVYSDHHSSLSNICCELQSMTQTQNQSMSAIKESLSSTSSRTFGNLQTEHVKLNSQMQMLLNKFKGLYKNAAVEETHYSSVKDFENELCVLQKKNDQLLLQFQSLEQCGSKWSDTLAEELKDCEIEFITELIYKKDDVIKNVEDGFSEVKVLLNGMENELKQELKCKEEFIEWLSEFQGLHFDTKKLNDGVLQENRRITGVIQNLTKKLKIIAQSKTKQDTMQYLNTLKTDLHEKKAKNLDLMQRMQKIAPSGDCSMLEEENARLRETLKTVQGELKGRIQDLEKQLSAVEADAKQKEQRALLLEDKLRSNVAESELYELQVIVKEKEQLLQAVQKEIQMLREYTLL